MSSLLAQFHDVPLAVAAYNAGPGAIVGRMIPRNGETEYYVPRVMAQYAQLAPRELRGGFHGAVHTAARAPSPTKTGAKTHDSRLRPRPHR